MEWKDKTEHHTMKMTKSNNSKAYWMIFPESGEGNDQILGCSNCENWNHNIQ